jgi:hypothetical protein
MLNCVTAFWNATPKLLRKRWVLASIYYSTGGEDWTSAEGWLSSASICEWEHIDCDLMHIDCDSMTRSLREIVLADNNLQSRCLVRYQATSHLGSQPKNPRRCVPGRVQHQVISHLRGHQKNHRQCQCEATSHIRSHPKFFIHVSICTHRSSFI